MLFILDLRLILARLQRKKPLASAKLPETVNYFMLIISYINIAPQTA